MSQEWQNLIPRWITEDQEYQHLRQGPQKTLQAIANGCSAPARRDGTESLLICFGGKGLIAASGCGRSTLWRHLRQLLLLGFVVRLGKGGGFIASVYGVPGRRGDLDEFRCDRKSERRIWKKTDTLFIKQKMAERACQLGAEQPNLAPQNGTALVPKRDGVRPKTGRAESQNGALSPLTHPIYHSDISPYSGGKDFDRFLGGEGKPNGEPNKASRFDRIKSFVDEIGWRSLIDESERNLLIATNEPVLVEAIDEYRGLLGRGVSIRNPAAFYNKLVEKRRKPIGSDPTRKGADPLTSLRKLRDQMKREAGAIK